MRQRWRNFGLAKRAIVFAIPDAYKKRAEQGAAMFSHEFSAVAIPAPIVTAGTLPTPLASSRLRGWNGIVVEHYRIHNVDAVAQSPAVLVTVHLGPPLTSVQARCKRTDRRRITKGRITITPPGTAKGWRNWGEADFVALWLAPALIRKIATETGEPRPERVEILDNSGTRDSKIEQLGLLLLSELECEGFGSRLYAESLANALVAHLLRRYSTAGAVVRPTATVLPMFKLRRATQYINDNLGRDVSLSEIACAVAMSPYHFARVFKQTTGIAPHQYLIGCRIECAKSLLRETDLSITEIAHRIGCTNQSHFSMLFHRATAMTPSMFRQQRWVSLPACAGEPRSDGQASIAFHPSPAVHRSGSADRCT